MPTAIVPASPAFDATGTPYSPEYGDVYHSAESGPGQARHVFLGGNDLPARWAGRRCFTIVETGFGLGLNFLATWQAWREHPTRCERLHYVSVEKHPFARAGLAALHARYPEFAPLAAQLQALWPWPLPGLHRLEFEAGRVTLTLALGDAGEMLPKLALAADAFYLDGFAPERNPEMWTTAQIKALARLARPEASAATYTAARTVREALAAAGFAVELRQGFGRKRHMIAARFAPLRPLRHAPAAAPHWSERRAIVIGAGLAGAAAAERLVARGWSVELLERRPAPAMEASALPAGAFHPLLARDDSLLARLARAGFLYALSRWHALETEGRPLRWARCGVLQVARDESEEARMAATVRALGLPAGFADYLPRAAAAQRVGCSPRFGGWWFPDAGWMEPAGLVTAQIAAMQSRGNLKWRAQTAVQGLERAGENWRALAADGTILAEAPLVVLANAHEAVRLAALAADLKRVRGQLTTLRAGELPALRSVLAGAGHLIPLPDGTAVIGASYDFEDENPEPTAAGHTANLARLAHLLPTAAGLEPLAAASYVGFRCVTSDRLPLIGALPDLAAVRARATALSGAGLRELPRLPGLYGALAFGSRGLVWAALGAELIAAAVENEPLPVEADLAGALDPGRFALRAVRRGSWRAPGQ